MGLQEGAEAVAEHLCAFATHMREMNGSPPDTVVVVVPPFVRDWEPYIKLAALLVLDLDPAIQFDWSNWP